jgi:hypothetical protein
LKETHRVLTDGEIIITTPNKYFPFETHSIKIGKRTIEPPIPLFSWLPRRVRKNYERARVYTTKELIKILDEVGFSSTINYIPPLLEGKPFPKKGRYLSVMRRLIEWLFSKAPVKYLSMSMLVVARKKEVSLWSRGLKALA